MWSSLYSVPCHLNTFRDDVITWKGFTHNWPFCDGNPPVTGGSPNKRQVMWSFGILFIVKLNQLLTKLWVVGYLRRRDAHAMWLLCLHVFLTARTFHITFIGDRWSCAETVWMSSRHHVVTKVNLIHCYAIEWIPPCTRSVYPPMSCTGYIYIYIYINYIIYMCVCKINGKLHYIKKINIKYCPSLMCVYKSCAFYFILCVVFCIYKIQWHEYTW